MDVVSWIVSMAIKRAIIFVENFLRAIISSLLFNICCKFTCLNERAPFSIGPSNGTLDLGNLLAIIYTDYQFVAKQACLPNGVVVTTVDKVEGTVYVAANWGSLY